MHVLGNWIRLVLLVGYLTFATAQGPPPGYGAPGPFGPGPGPGYGPGPMAGMNALPPMNPPAGNPGGANPNGNGGGNGGNNGNGGNGGNSGNGGGNGANGGSGGTGGSDGLGSFLAGLLNDYGGQGNNNPAAQQQRPQQQPQPNYPPQQQPQRQRYPNPYQQPQQGQQAAAPATTKAPQKATSAKPVYAATATTTVWVDPTTTTPSSTGTSTASTSSSWVPFWVKNHMTEFDQPAATDSSADGTPTDAPAPLKRKRHLDQRVFSEAGCDVGVQNVDLSVSSTFAVLRSWLDALFEEWLMQTRTKKTKRTKSG